MLVAVACGPDARETLVDGGVGTDADPLARAYVSGRVWAPNQGPGQAAPGQEIPVFGASVYLATERPPPIPEGVYCEQCLTLPSGGVASNHDGTFTVGRAPGTYWLVIQKGQFRLDQQITIGTGTLDLPPSQTTLPSEHDPAAGKFIPKIALVLGGSDPVETIMGKIGLGTMNGNAFASAGGELDLYGYGFSSLDTVGDFADLVNDPAKLAEYHVIFFPCSTSVSTFNADLNNQAGALRNLRQYIADGGKMYVTDWSGEVSDRPFPPQITMGGSGTDTTGTYDWQTLSGTITSAGDSDNSYYDSPDAEVLDDDLAAWLGMQTGPLPGDPTPTPYNPDAFPITGSWNWIASVQPYPRGLDPDTGLVVDDVPKVWVQGSGSGTAGKKPMTVTFEPTGCGRVLYSVYQTATYEHAGLTAQERILLYLIMEIGVCTDQIIVE